jgi:hypothetical protein
MASITINNFKDGNSTTLDIGYTDRFAIRGQKMYVWKLDDLIDVLTKEELKQLIRIFDDTKLYTKANILKVSFTKATQGLKPVARSRLKKKLLENGIILEYNGKIMINPYILVPRNDKDIRNFQYLVQKTYKYLTEDKDIEFEGRDEFIDYIFNQ